MSGNLWPAVSTDTRQERPDGQALAALRFGWGEAYRIGWDAVRGWWAWRCDGLGSDITAADPDQLWHAIRKDYDLKPVPRDCAAAEAGS
jgi:hypothetical protein